MKTFRNNWLEFTPEWSGFAVKYGIGSYFDSRHMIQLYLLWGKLFIHLPIKSTNDEHDPPTYGISYHDRAFWFHYGRKYKAVHMPYDYGWIRTSLLLKDGTWEHETRGNSKDFWQDEWKDKAFREEYPYSYTLRSGEVQSVTATVTVNQREWRQKWLKWTSLFAKVRTSIEIEFSGEVGERAKSWKGGVLGCGYDIKGGETVLEALSRMERERKFN